MHPHDPAPSPDGIKRQMVLARFAQEISLVAEEAELYRVAARLVRQILPFVDRCSIALLLPPSDAAPEPRLSVFALDGSVGTIPLGAELPADGTMLGEVIQTRGPVLYDGDRFTQSDLLDLHMLAQQGLRATLDVPLITGGQVIGTLNTGTKQVGAYGPDDAEALSQIAGLMSTHIERWRLIARLRNALEEARRLSAVLETTPELVTIADLNGDFLYMNAAGVRLLGLAGEDIRRFNVREVADPERSIPFEQIRAAVREHGTWRGERFLRRKDGASFPVSQVVTLIRDEAGAPAALGSIAHDIRARKQAEQERERLIAELRRTTALIETTTDFVCLVGLGGEVLYINPAGMQLIGRAGEDPTCFRASEIVAGEVSPSVEAVSASVRERGSWSGERYFRHKDGHLIPVDQVVTLVRDKDGEPFCFGSIAHDVTERRQTLIALRQAKEGAEAASRAKTAFLAKMSHELRTPLNAILGFTQLLCREEGLRAEHHEYLRIIRKSGEHLLSLINDTLEMSKIEAGRITLRPEIFDLHELIAGIDAMLRLRAEDKGLALRCLLGQDLPLLVRTDAAKLRQVLLNLLGNAVKFTERGEVVLRSLVQTRDDTRREARIHFEVEDTGPGIAEEEQASLFEPFYQAEAGLRAQEGAGLGLPISQQFVRLLGGHIELVSAPGRGTRFSFDVVVDLPDDRQEQGNTGARTGRARRVLRLDREASAPELRVLVVEDRWQNRTLLCRLLRSVGFTVLEAENGQEGVDQWTRHAPELIWMDMAMPVMDGREATRRIRASALPGARRTVIIALTASAFEEEREAVLALGCDDFVRKPFEEQDIFEKMALHLGVRYIYEAEEAGPAPVRHGRGLTPADLRGLPAAWVSALRQAARELDPELIRGLVAEIRGERPELAGAIDALVEGFEFDRLLELTEGA